MLSLSDILKFLVLRPLQGTCKYAVCSPFSFLHFYYFFSLFTPWLYLVVWFFISLFCRSFFCSFDSLSSSFNFISFFFFVILINSLLPCRLSVLFLFYFPFVFFLSHHLLVLGVHSFICLLGNCNCYTRCCCSALLMQSKFA